MQEGIRLGAQTFDRFLTTLGWGADEIGRTFCHQVGVAHRKLMLERFGLSAERDFSTVEWLGNTGSVALPITMALGLEANGAKPGDKIAMLGIGSGINVVMLGVEW
jgi:3-oxoacyl-[acyl-carrier-protein] synthase-3